MMTRVPIDGDNLPQEGMVLPVLVALLVVLVVVEEEGVQDVVVGGVAGVGVATDSSVIVRVVIDIVQMKVELQTVEEVEMRVVCPLKAVPLEWEVERTMRGHHPNLSDR